MDYYHTSPQLPFDVLGLVFSYYSEEETILYPLETLLLVCRSWSKAAQGHRALWSRLRMLIEHEPGTSIWRTRLPLRLARCGPEVPLDIVLHNLLESRLDSEISLDSFADAIPGKGERFNSCPTGWTPSFDPCPCYAAASAFIHSSLELLSSDRGELCRRWRSFKLITGNLPPGMQNARCMNETLCYPTPILTTLVLKGLSSFSPSSFHHFQLFPDTPVLKKVTILDCDIRVAPKSGNVDEVEMGIIDWQNPMLNTPTFNLGTRLRRLSLWLAPQVDIKFPSALPNLRDLKLVINVHELPSDMSTCEMPQLTSLSLGVIDVSTLYDLLRCQGINLSRLKELTLDLKLMGRDETMDHFLSNSIIKLLKRASQSRVHLRG